MSADLRTELNDADNVTGWTGDGNAPTLNTLTGQRYEGTGAIDTQHSNTQEHMWTTQTSGGGGTFSLDLSDSTVYLLAKDNLVDTYANGGMEITLGDGTDDIGYDVAGNDAVGLPLSPYYNCIKLDVSEVVATPGSFTTYAGSEANLDQTVITQVGYGSLHLAKAQGNVANVFVDRITYIANGSYALRINGGTLGTPETMADVQGDDATNGWGMVNNPLGSQYGFFAPTEWGEPAANADAYFTATNEQWFWIGDNGGGRSIGTGNFPFRVVGNATDTISFVLDNVVIVNTGARATFDMSSADVNTLQLSSVTFTDLGAITFPVQSVGNKFANNCIFNNCDQAYLSTLDMDAGTFNGTTNANGAILWDGSVNTANQDNLAFNSDGTGHAIEISLDTAALTTFNIDGYAFDGYAGQSGTAGNRVFYIDNLQDGDVTINLSNSTASNVVGGGSGFSFEVAAGYTGTVTINSTVTVTVTVRDEDGNAVEGARVRLEDAGTGTLVTQGSTNASGVYTDNVSFSADQDILLKVRLKGFKNFRTSGTITASGFSAGVRFVADPAVDLP